SVVRVFARGLRDAGQEERRLLRGLCRRRHRAAGLDLVYRETQGDGTGGIGLAAGSEPAGRWRGRSSVRPDTKRPPEGGRVAYCLVVSLVASSIFLADFFFVLVFVVFFMVSPLLMVSLPVGAGVVVWAKAVEETKARARVAMRSLRMRRPPLVFFTGRRTITEHIRVRFNVNDQLFVSRPAIQSAFSVAPACGTAAADWCCRDKAGRPEQNHGLAQRDATNRVVLRYPCG